MRFLLLSVFLLPVTSPLLAQRSFPVAAPVVAERTVGPYNVHVLYGGGAFVRPIPATSAVLQAEGAYTLLFWFEKTADTPRTTLIAGIGDPLEEDSHFIGLRDGRLVLHEGATSELAANAPSIADGWHSVAVSSDGASSKLHLDGAQVAEGFLPGGRIASRLIAGPVAPGFDHFGGPIALITLEPRELSSSEIRQTANTKPDFTLLRWDEASPGWPVQTRGQAGYTAQQDPSLMPHGRAPFSNPVAKPLSPLSPSALDPLTPSAWTIAHNWMLVPAPGLNLDGPQLSSPSLDTHAWMRATVPGTVLTTMIDRGIYPDPDFGLNNMAIPESLNKQDYWYRVEFETPAHLSGKQWQLHFNGINYTAEVWLNGKVLGNIRGAFIRGQFDVTEHLRPSGRNTLAVRISPPPHPGIPQEQSMLGGPGENGGALCLDGPTFVATEGWDWIPAIRDRNTGIWQDVTLTATDALRLGDPQIITKLPLPDTNSADVSIDVPVENLGKEATTATVHAQFEGVEVAKQVNLQPGSSKVHFDSAEFPALHVTKPRLWWPNGYGKPELYHLKLSAGDSDHREVTFGIREISYELSLFDAAGHLRRVEVAPTAAKQRNEQVVDVRHAAMKQTAEFYAASLTPAGEHSSAVRPIANENGLTDLVLRVNGVRIAARGGNWGMDDSRKRVSRDRLEPFFRLHREANVNIIRNWVGQETEETFFQLADEYGMMVWNDFWASTQDYNVEPQDVPLFLRNARDVVARFRNHPSIVIWCGRNEGVPQPILNEGLIDIFREEDGTRYYTPGSNRINLRNSGPYRYQDPKLFYTTLDRGFSVELGIASLSTLESLKTSIAEPDLWPISDAWAYHDWHQSGNGEVAPLMQHIEQEFGAATSLKDFERKAQMFNYVDHRAIFEGFNQHLWKPNSGRMLWMTQPAWPSNMWQIFSSDYDTQASFYGVKLACEPLHVQLDLSDFTVAAINTTSADAGAVTVSARVYSLSNKLLLTKDSMVDLGSNAAHDAFQLALAPFFTSDGLVLVRLEMKDATGRLLSHNLYWLAEQEKDYRVMNTMAPAEVSVSSTMRHEGGEYIIQETMRNAGTVAALAAKSTLLDTRSKQRVLPAYFSDNYISLLPGELQTTTIHVPDAQKPANGWELTLRGWNIPEKTFRIP